MNNLSILTNQSTIKSTELVEIINEFRKAEGNENILQHNDFMKKVRKEIETLENLNLGGQGNFSQSSYINSQNKKQPCFELNRDGMLQMLNSESIFVRYKTIEYINKLEEAAKPKKLSAMDQLKLQYEVLEEHEERFNKIENQLERLEVNPSQRKLIQNARHKKVFELLGGKKGIAYKDSSFRSKVYSELGRAFNNYFDVTAYDCTPKNRLEEALEFVDSYNLSAELNMELKRINNQISFNNVEVI